MYMYMRMHTISCEAALAHNVQCTCMYEAVDSISKGLVL